MSDGVVENGSPLDRIQKALKEAGCEVDKEFEAVLELVSAASEDVGLTICALSDPRAVPMDVAVRSHQRMFKALCALTEHRS